MRSAAVEKPRKLKVKKGDQVQVIAGKAKGETGEVERVDLQRRFVYITDVNMHQRHTKPRRQGESGGILPLPGAIHISNVLPYCESCNRGVRKVCEKPADCHRYKKRK